ncbi:coil containing protein [Vibrio phage 1.121.O._10N.286.46.C4]|nr:coil containing protein [Vibrio phage 1.121.O._10N.286.46.C4]
MPDLNLKSKKKFKPHMALTGLCLNGGAANLNNDVCISKSKFGITDEIELLKRLKKDSPEGIEKASVRNVENQLRALLKEKLKPVGSEYYWVYIEDFDDSTVVFESEGNKSYSMSFTVNENGIVELSDEEAVEVVPQRIFVKVDGSELILKGADEAPEEGEQTPEDVKSDGESLEGTKPSELNNEEEEIPMEDNTQVSAEAIEKAVAAALEKERARVAADKATAETTEIVKGYGFVAEDSVELLVKGLVADAVVAEVILKSFDAAQQEVADVKAEMEVVKAKFGEQEQQADDSEPAEIEKGAEAAKAARLARVRAAKK